MKRAGRIIGISGPTVSVDCEGLRLYDRVVVGRNRLCGEVVRLERQKAVVQVYENTLGLAVGEPVEGLGLPLTVKLGPGLLGRLFDGLQRPLEALREATGPFIRSGHDPFPLDCDRLWPCEPLKKIGETVTAGEPFAAVAEGPFRHLLCAPAAGRIASLHRGEWPLQEPLGQLEDGTVLRGWQEWPARKPRPYKRKLAPGQPLMTGQRCLDFLFPLVRGGTAIFPGGFGTGKTVLEQSLAKYADVDVVIYVGCGERGNEMAELLDEIVALKDPWTGGALMDRTLIVANTSNMPVAAREASLYTAVTVAEYYRDMGLHVLLLADSVSRWAEALREISSSLEEMPGEEGYPTYLNSRLAGFFERAGLVETASGALGSLSMVLAVSPPGGDFTEPVTQACLRAAGAFYMLDTALAHSRHFPAVHWGQSYSLYASGLMEHFAETVSPRWPELVRRCRDLLLREQGVREVAEIVGLEGLQDADRLLIRVAECLRRDFLCQNAYTAEAFSTPEQTLQKVSAIVEAYDRARQRLEDDGLLDEALAELDRE